MKSNSTFATKSQLLDYVSKSEFNEFKQEMYNFRDSMYDFKKDSQDQFHKINGRFNDIDKRFNNIDRRFDRLTEEFRIHTGTILQQSREDFKVAMEYMRHVETKKLDKEEFEALEHRINQRIH